MYDIPIYHQEYQCDVPGSWTFKSTRMKLNQEQNNELDRNIAVWRYNYRHLPIEMQDLYLNKHICQHLYRKSLKPTP